MDDVSAVVTGIGALTDDSLDVFVAAQAGCPLNFKELTEVLLTREGEPGTEFWLATLAATAIIRLAECWPDHEDSELAGGWVR